MPAYDFYVAHIRFVVRKTDRETDVISEMMDHLSVFADQVESGGDIEVPGPHVRSLARGLAGVAGFLQQHILPETIAAENKSAENQIRWVIDNSMALMATLMVHAETNGDQESCNLVLPAPPDTPLN